MKQGAPPIRLALIVLTALVLFASPLPALAQSCALCYTQAASAGSRMIEALKSGILILIVPPTLISIGMVFIMYRNRNRCRDAAGTAESDRDLEQNRSIDCNNDAMESIHAITDPPAKNTIPSKLRDYLPVILGTMMAWKINF
jgi:hypothetical protein